MLSVAYEGNALDTMAKVKEQIMLNGGVLASLALSNGVNGAFQKFVANKISANGAFSVAEDLRLAVPGDVAMHAVFCYGWWDHPARAEDGYWICKNRWVRFLLVRRLVDAVGVVCEGRERIRHACHIIAAVHVSRLPRDHQHECLCCYIAIVKQL